MHDILKAGGLILKDRKVLLERHGGKDIYIVPGGKLEAGESAQEALIRECEEEFHIAVKEIDLEYVGKFASRATHNPDKIVQIETFIIKKWQGEITLDDGIEGIVWVNAKTMKDYNVSDIAENNILPLLLKMQLID